MKITGYIKNESKEPIRDARVELFRVSQPGEPIDVVPSGERGEFELSPDQHAGQSLRIVVTKNGRVIAKQDIPSGKATGLVLIAADPDMKITGRVTNERNEPIRDATVELFLISEPKDPIQVVPSGEYGEFEFSRSQNPGQPLKIVVAKKGFVTREQDLPSGKGTGLELVLAEPLGDKGFWPKIIFWWKRSNWQVRAAAVASLVLLFVIIVWPQPCKEVRVTITAPNTNVTLTLTNSTKISRVSVSLNGEQEQVFANLKGNPAFINVTSTFAASSATIRINNQEPTPFEIIPIPLDNGAVRDAELRIKDSLIAIERLCIGMTELEVLRKKQKPDLKGIERVTTSLDYWRREYSSKIKELATNSVEVVAQAGARFQPGVSDPEQQGLFSAMLPLMGEHISAMKRKGVMPNGFESDLHKRYQKLPKALKTE